MKRATLRELAEIILALPEEVQGLEIRYLDLAHSTKDEYETAFDNLEAHYGDVGMCCN